MKTYLHDGEGECCDCTFLIRDQETVEWTMNGPRCMKCACGPILEARMRIDEALPAMRGPKIAFHVIGDGAAFAAWCAERGTTPDAHMQRMVDLTTPKDDG